MSEFTQQTFLGASISDFNIDLGWNEQSTAMSVFLVEDEENGDLFTPKVRGNEFFIGCPVYFQYNDWKFGGILQNWVQSQSTGGFPTYKVDITDPKEILDGIQLILNNFQLQGNDATFYKNEMPNLFNIFDFWETDPIAIQFGGGSFGGAGVNENGMLWSLVRDGYIHLQNAYGPARTNGVSIFIDFAGLPTPPLDYRVKGDYRTLSETISELCRDSGVDYFCYLEYFPEEPTQRQHQVKFKTVSRLKQPTLGQIKTYVENKLNQTDDNKIVSEYSTGLEFRNDVVSFLLLGGNREDLFIADNLQGSYNIFNGNILDVANPPTYFDNTKIRPFFGFDIDGKVITCSDLNDDTVVNLNCTAIYNILGSTSYSCTIFELRCALYNYETWQAAFVQYNSEKALQIGFDIEKYVSYLTEVYKELEKESTNSSKLQPSDKIWANLAGKFAAGEQTQNILQTLYMFVSKTAQEYYGTKFIVLLPNVRWKLVPDTGEIVYEYEITDSGWVQPDYGDVNTKTGLDRQNEVIFTDNVGKFYAFCRFDNVLDKDVSEVNISDAVLEDGGNTLFTRIEVESYFVNPVTNPIELIFNNSPGRKSAAAIITVPLIKNVPKESFGSIEDIAKLLGELTDKQKENYKKMDANRFYNQSPYAIVPRAIAPSVVTIPIKSNVYSYGPWKTTGFDKGGKVMFEKDDSLVPWNFGDYSNLNYAAEAKILNAVTRMTVGETGSVTEAGAPTIPLGEVIKAGGPIVTSINVTTGSNGIRTTYIMKTYTPKFGAFSWNNAERLRLLSERASIARNNSRKRIQNTNVNIFKGHNDRVKFLSELPVFAKRTGGTPHEGLVAYVDKVDDDSKQTTIASDISTSLIGKMAGNPRKGDMDEEIKKMGVIGMEGLFRPYQTKFDAETTYLPKFTQPTSSGAGNPNVKDLNPFKDGHDISIVLQTENGTYKDFINRGDPSEDLQPIGLKTPIVAVGWGYDTAGNPVPSSAPGKFLENYQKKPETWKAGPIDLRWDEERGVWSTGTSLRLCELDELIYPGKLVNATVLKEGKFSFSYERTDSKIKVAIGYQGVILSSGTRCWVTPFGRTNYIIGAGP